MVVIALTGPVGSGKTTVLDSLADWSISSRKVVDGFVATGRDREAGNRGARTYVLKMLADGREMPFARRDPTLTPPYAFDPATSAELIRWSAALEVAPRKSIIILDEFGPMEAEGGGHVMLWPSITKAAPQVVVIAVRHGLEDRIRERLGVEFDRVIRADEPDAGEHLRRACVEAGDWTRVGMYGAASGGFEASVGSALHGAQVPLRGLFLSSVQSAMMTYAGDGLGHRGRVVWVPFISASLKALSPSGSRLRPMLAISIQGMLYAMAVTVLGWNVLSTAAGGFLVGVWSAVQGVALQYLFVGSDLIRAYDTVIHWIAGALHLALPGVITLFVVWSAFCGTVGAVFTIIAWKRRHRLPARLTRMLARGASVHLGGGPAPTPGKAMLRGLRDLLRPVFWLPVLIVVAVLLLAGSPWESAMWIVVRAAGIGFVVFSLAGAFDPRRFIRWLKRKGYRGPALAYEHALRKSEDPH